MNFRTLKVVAWGDGKPEAGSEEVAEEDQDTGERVTLEDVVTRLSMPGPGTALSPHSLTRRGRGAGAFHVGNGSANIDPNGVKSIASTWGFAGTASPAGLGVTNNQTADGITVGSVAGMNLDWEERLLQDISRWIVRTRKSPASAYRELLQRGRKSSSHSLLPRRSSGGFPNRHQGLDAEELQAALQSLGREESEESPSMIGDYWSVHPISPRGRAPAALTRCRRRPSGW